MRILQTTKRNLRVPKAEVKQWVRHLLPDATGRLKTILFHEPTETFHFSTQWLGPYPDFGQGTQVVVKIAEPTSTANMSASNVNNSDMALPVDGKNDPPAHVENEKSDSATAIYESADPPSSIPHESTSIPSPLTVEPGRCTAQIPSSVDEYISKENQSSIDGSYHRFLSPTQHDPPCPLSNATTPTSQPKKQRIRWDKDSQGTDANGHPLLTSDGCTLKWILEGDNYQKYTGQIHTGQTKTMMVSSVLDIMRDNKITYRTAEQIVDQIHKYEKRYKEVLEWKKAGATLLRDVAQVNEALKKEILKKFPYFFDLVDVFGDCKPVDAASRRIIGHESVRETCGGITKNAGSSHTVTTEPSQLKHQLQSPNSTKTDYTIRHRRPFAFSPEPCDRTTKQPGQLENDENLFDEMTSHEDDNVPAHKRPWVVMSGDGYVYEAEDVTPPKKAKRKMKEAEKAAKDALMDAASVDLQIMERALAYLERKDALEAAQKKRKSELEATEKKRKDTSEAAEKDGNRRVKRKMKLLEAEMEMFALAMKAGKPYDEARRIAKEFVASYDSSSD